MPSHGFGRAYRQFVGVFAESPFYSGGFDLVTDFGGGTMRVDVIDLIRLNTGILNGAIHHAKGPVAILGRAGDVVRIGAHSVADDFRQYSRPSLASQLQFFQDEHARSFTHHETIAFRIPGPRGFLRLVIALGKSAHRGKTADAHGRDGRFRASADHDVRVAALD